MRIFHKGLLDIFILAMLWGPSFVFIKIALSDVTPITIVTLRIGLGALFLYLFLKWKRIVIPKNRALWMHGFVLGLFANSLPFMCFNYALQTISTSLSALINGTTPILTILLANIFLKDEPLTWNRGIGVIIGLSGFLVLFLPAVLGLDVGGDTFGMFFSFLGASSYSIGMIYGRLFVQHAPAYIAPMLQLFTSVFYLIPIAFVIEDPIPVLQKASLSTWGAMVGLAFLGTTLAFIMYYRILLKQGATALSMVTYLLPIIGTILGVVFLHERIGLHFVAAALLILCGVLVVNGALPKFKRQKEEKV